MSFDRFTNKKKRLSVVLFLITIMLFPSIPKRGRNDVEQQLLEEIDHAYYSLDRKGFQDFVKKNSKKLKFNFLVDMGRWGREEDRGDWTTIAEKIARELKLSHALAYILVIQAEIYLFHGQNYARNALDDAISLFKRYNDNRGLGAAFRKKAIILAANEGIESGIKLLKTAVFYSSKANDAINLGFEYLQLAMHSTDLGRYEDSLINLRNCLFYFKKSNFIRGIAHYKLEMGRINFETFQYKKAEENYQEGYELFKKIGEQNGIGSTMKGLGDIYYKLNDFQQANEYYDIAIEGYWKWNSWSAASNIFLRKGEMYVLEGNYLEAIRCYNLALPFYWDRHESLGQGDTFKAIGDIHFMRFDYDTAELYYNNALHYYEQTDANVQLGDIYVRRGVICLFNRQFKSAEDMFYQAYSFYQIKKDYVGQGNVMKDLGDVHFAMRDELGALVFYEQALLLLEKGLDSIDRGVVYSRIADVELKRNNLTRALTMYDRAIELHKRTGDIESESFSRHSRAVVLERIGNIQEAKHEFQIALENFEHLRVGTAFHSLKKSYMKEVLNLYQETVIFMLKHDFNEDAFRFADAMKARLFLDQLVEGLVPITKRLSPGIASRYNRLFAQLSSICRQINHTDAKGNQTMARLQNQRNSIRLELNEVQIMIKAENPVYSSIQYPEPMSSDFFAKKTLNVDEILIQYFVTREKTYAFIVSRNRFKIVSLEVTESELLSKVTQLREILGASKVNKLTRYRIANKLYRDIFKPIEKFLCASKELIIVPDGVLAFIPFESLILNRFNNDKHPTYLVEKFRTKYIQSASVLSILRTYYRRLRDSDCFVGFGDPVYDYENFSKNSPDKGAKKVSEDSMGELFRDKFQKEGGKFYRIKGSGEEVKKIASLFEEINGGTSVVRLREKAIEDVVKAGDMKNYDYIHFACHGLLSDGFQSLVLSQDVPEQSDDGYLTLNEMMNCEFNAKLVVLSACDTGSGTLERGEGVTGLTRAVMYAGTPAVVASLWKVDDEATKELMTRFYQNFLKRNMTKSEALRQAKLSLLNEEKFSSPRYWSAFVMYGE